VHLVPPRTTSRRRFLKALGAGAAVAMLPLAACTNTSEQRPGPGTPVSGARRYDLGAVTEAFEDAIKSGEAAGISLNAVKGGDVIYRRAFGTLIVGQSAPLGDATSMPSAMLLLALADAGKLSLDDQVQKFVPSLTGGVTVRQLLTHTSGLPSDAPVLSDTSIDLEAAAEAIAKLPRVSKPGETFRYGAVSYQVAGRVAEVAGGKRWDDLFHDYIAEPTGLTGFTYGNKTRNWRIFDGAQSSADDYARLLDVQLHEGLFSTKRVLSEGSVKLMQTDQVKGLPVATPPPTPSTGYTIGWNIATNTGAGAPERLVAAGGAGAYSWLDLKDDYAACLLVDGPLSTSQKLAERIEPLITTALSRPL
jgi:CubicO group peptidase (beta-lactamase class C family)